MSRYNVAAVATQRGPLSLNQAKRLGEKLNSALVGGRVLGSATPAGRAFALECLEKAGVLLEEQQSMSDDELRSVLAAAAAAAVAEIESHVRVSSVSDSANSDESESDSSEKGKKGGSSRAGVKFMAGETPDAADALMATVLLVAHNLLESGVASLPQSPCSLASLDGPSLLAYLQLWAERPSWLASYRTKSLRYAAAIRPVVASLVSKAPDVCTVGLYKLSSVYPP